ncbi:hypothetical protein JCM8097_008339 [Rhodosporidiobolus ruineniae]
MANESSTSPTRFCIIGAGVYGLTTALRLLNTADWLEREIEVEVLDAGERAGGTWAEERAYPGLLTNNSWSQMLPDDGGETKRLFEENERFRAGPGGFRASSTGMAAVMDSHFQQVSSCPSASFRFSTRVVRVEQPEHGGWNVTSTPISPGGFPPASSSSDPLPSFDATSAKQTGGSGTTKIQHYDKLIIATGSFSSPSVPACAVPKSVQHALSGERKRRVVVVGASKSSLDAAEQLAQKGHDVTLVFRSAPWLAPPALRNPKTGQPADAAAMVAQRFKLSYLPFPRDVLTSRLSTSLLASLYRSFLHSTRLGSLLHSYLQRKTEAKYAAFGRWDRLPFLRPQNSLLWSEAGTVPAPVGLHELLEEGRNKVLKGRVSGMREVEAKKNDDGAAFELDVLGAASSTDDPSTVSLLSADVVIFGTGWRTGSYPFFTRSEQEDLGLPLDWVDGEEEMPPREREFEALDAEREEELRRENRCFKERPWREEETAEVADGKVGRKRTAPFRLYRSMIPLSHLYSRDIAFAGTLTAKANHLVAITQAHWLADYFLSPSFPSTPSIPSLDLAKREVALHFAWSRLMFGPVNGKIGHWVGAGWVEVVARLCGDMHVNDDGAGLFGTVTAASYAHLERERRERDADSRGSQP